MKYFYFFLLGLITLAALYSITGVVFFKWGYYQIEHPKAQFQIIDSPKNDLTIVDFTNYRCAYCKAMHPTIKEALDLHENIRYIPRPILLKINPDDKFKQEPVQLEKLVMAAGMQGKFKEMHDAFMEYPEGIIPESIIKETAALYGIDYEKMVKDSKSEKVQKYLDDNTSDMVGMNIPSVPSYIVGKTIYVVQSKIPDLKDFLTMITNEKTKNE